MGESETLEELWKGIGTDWHKFDILAEVHYSQMQAKIYTYNTSKFFLFVCLTSTSKTVVWRFNKQQYYRPDSCYIVCTFRNYLIGFPSLWNNIFLHTFYAFVLFEAVIIGLGTMYKYQHTLVLHFSKC